MIFEDYIKVLVAGSNQYKNCPKKVQIMNGMAKKMKIHSAEALVTVWAEQGPEIFLKHLNRRINCSQIIVLSLSRTRERMNSVKDEFADLSYRYIDIYGVYKVFERF